MRIMLATHWKLKGRGEYQILGILKQVTWIVEVKQGKFIVTNSKQEQNFLEKEFKAVVFNLFYAMAPKSMKLMTHTVQFPISVLD